MRIKDLEAALAVHETGSFSKAAERLGSSQPAVSMAVQRLERDLQLSLFDRTGGGARVTRQGLAAIKAFQKIRQIVEELQETSRRAQPLKIAVTPLLSGRDVVEVLEEATDGDIRGFDVEFLESETSHNRPDFDVRISLPSLRKKSTFCVDLPTEWIGVDNRVLILSRQEPEIWNRAQAVLSNSAIQVDRVITVNDCGYAYHMAVAGAGFTPCVMTRNISFREHRVAGLPPLPAARIDIFAPFDLALALRRLIGSET